MVKLDGINLLRFAHAFKTGGGVEQYLNDLDRALLSRNNVTIIRMYLAKEPNERTQIEKVGPGTLITVPLKVKNDGPHSHKIHRRDEFHCTVLRSFIRDWIIYNPILYQILFQNIIKKRALYRGEIEVIDAREEVRNIFNNYSIDLLIMHYVGGGDSAAIIEEATKKNIPFIVQNHFSNDRFNHLSIREQIVHAAGIAGVTSVDIPKRLKNSYVNLADGINMDMLNPNAAHSLDLPLNFPVVLLPARLVPTKGHRDLIRACAVLKKKDVNCTVVFAGRSDSSEYEESLRDEAIQSGIIDRVLFAGELNLEGLRDWYGVASIVALPTYHHEGLPRVLLEAQAMQVPPVVYISGGTADGVLDSRTGYLLKRGDIEGLALRLHELLIDEKKRREMGREGRKFVEEKFSLEALATRHEQYYLQVLKKVNANKYREQ